MMDENRRVEQAVLARVDRCFDGAVDFLRDLLRQPSTLGNERGAQDLVRLRLAGLGLSPRMWDIDLSAIRDHSLFIDLRRMFPDLTYEDRPNVTCVVPAAGAGGRSLAFNGHIDVVSPEPLDQWSRDPWGAELEGDWLFGRGAADMKSGIAALLLAVEAMHSAGVGLRGDLFVQSVIEEESGGNGALACVIGEPPADAAIITEPSGHVGAFQATIGLFWFRVRVQGRSAHPYEARSGVNAIEKMALILPALRRLEERMNLERKHPAFRSVEHPINLVVGIIRGGDWPSTVAGECTIECRLSFEPGMCLDEALDLVRGAVAEAALADDWLRDNPPVVECFGVKAEPSVTDPSSPVVRLLQECHLSVTGESLALDPFTGSTDQRFFANQGGCDAIGYGPMGLGFHGADERVYIPSIRSTAKALALFALRWCGIERT
jgi:acetylornithine deacetylase